MQEAQSAEKINIQDAAKNLGVSTKTIQRYLARGLLTKIKEGRGTRVLVAELRALASPPDEGLHKGRSTRQIEHRWKRATEVVTVQRVQYESLLIELGELRKQSQLHNELTAIIHSNEAAIERLGRQLEQLAERLKTLEEGHSLKEVKPAEKTPKVEPAGNESVKLAPQKPWWQK